MPRFKKNIDHEPPRKRAKKDQNDEDEPADPQEFDNDFL
jgi:hypothetical protein